VNSRVEGAAVVDRGSSGGHWGEEKRLVFGLRTVVVDRSGGGRHGGEEKRVGIGLRASVVEKWVASAGPGLDVAVWSKISV
jgi:hypothetical protein